MDREPIVGDRVKNKQTGEKGRIIKVTDDSCWGFYVKPDDYNEPPYWEAVWNLEIIAAAPA